MHEVRLIDANALLRNNGLDKAVKYGNKDAEQQNMSYSTMMLYEIADMIEDAPTIEAEPVKHGLWEKNEAKQRLYYPYKCSVCNEVNEYPFPYCPICGARMDAADTNVLTKSEPPESEVQDDDER